VEVTRCETIYALTADDEVMPRAEECSTYYEYVCDGDSSCQECDGGGDGGGSGGGGSGGGSGSGSDLLPYYDGISDAEMLENLDVVFAFETHQINYLNTHTHLINTIYDSYNSTTDPDERARLLFLALDDNIDPLIIIQVEAEIAILKELHPTWPKWKVVGHAFLNVFSGTVHTVLDLVGLIPGLGEGADFVNAGLYLIEGDKENALISLASTIPFVGWTASGSRLCFKVIKTATNTNAKLWLKEVDGVIYFSKGIRESGSQLRTILKTPTGFQAHHVIPWAFKRNSLVQKAARSGKFHMNDHLNGISLDLSVHNGYDTAHRLYDQRLSETLDSMEILYGNESPEFIFNKLKSLIDSIKGQLSNGKKLDQVVFSVP